MAVYILHFDRPYHHARHYLGFTTNLRRRVRQHRTADSSYHRLVQAVVAAGIGFTVARVWEDGDRDLERRLKRWKNTPDLCPVCREQRRGV